MDGLSESRHPRRLDLGEDIPCNNHRSTAKVSTAEKDEPRHVICVYNENFTDNAEVRELESRLRAIGIRCTMQYKPDVFTYLGVYRGNEWNLRPVMYVSDFDLRKNSSTIVSNYDQV